MNEELARFVLARPFGFITSAEMPALLAMAPRALLLVRCGCGRFVCEAKDLAGRLAAVDQSGDYVRDVSFPCQVLDAARSYLADLETVCLSA